MNLHQLTAVDVATLRREVAGWYRSGSGVGFYYQAILVGRQPVRPPGPPGQVARWLADQETRRLTEGDLWFVDDDLCTLLQAAHPTMPAFVAQPQDLPSRYGFVVFAQPIVTYDRDHTGDEALAARLEREAERLHAQQPGSRPPEETGEAVRKVFAAQAPIVAASWGPLTNPNWPNGGVWVSFYALSQIHTRDDLFPDAATTARARVMSPPLMVDNELVLPWPVSGLDTTNLELHPGREGRGTSAWGRVLFAAFLLAAQTNLAEQSPLRPDRAERRRTSHADLPPRDVRVVRLRRHLRTTRDTEAAAAGGGDPGRVWRHRWLVRGHWRNQWYARTKENRPRWIAPYLKGPDDAPLIGGDKVTVLDAPPHQPSNPEGNPR